jgi:DNA-binding LytR/AlgR family response regulator
MEDHYVRIRTEHGSRLEMGPLARVTAMLSGVEGLQTHRSWWVARRAITGVERDGRNLRLRLVDGETAPVSRASVAKLRAAGWLAADAD